MRYNIIMITQQSIDNLKNHLDVVDTVSSYVQLKKAGANYKGLCPFHGEDTPSFVVSPPKADLPLLRLWCRRRLYQVCDGA
jgi:hypothetical protein